MSEPSWADGYVVDVDYTHGYYRELAPATLRFVALLGSLQAPDAEQPFTYYELGCGNGHSLTLHAAANPRGQFIGADFNPTHIHNARQFAQECGVENVQFLEKSFAELVAMELPEAEFVTLHGVHSWVSDENRRQIVEFIRQRLKPGGIVYLSYNCLPGLGPVQPLQRLLHEHAERGTGPLPERVRHALDFARQMSELGADYFRMNPMAQARLGRLSGQDARYLAHEYFNANWAPSYHLDIARELAQAKLTYAGSAQILDNFDQFVLKPEIAQLALSVGDPALAETLKDFARNQTFRRDVFTRGAPRASGAQLDALLGRSRFALAQPRAGCSFKRKMPAGEVTLQEAAYAPVLDALARGPLSFDELVKAPATARLDRARVRQAVFGMAALNNVVLALPAAGEAERRAATARYNQAVRARPLDPSGLVLASPVTGVGIRAPYTDAVFLGGPREPARLADYAQGVIKASGRTPMKDGKPVEDERTARAMLEERAKLFLESSLPFLRASGIAD